MGLKQCKSKQAPYFVDRLAPVLMNQRHPFLLNWVARVPNYGVQYLDAAQLCSVMGYESVSAKITVTFAPIGLFVEERPKIMRFAI
jgi:hypothetical protein